MSIFSSTGLLSSSSDITSIVESATENYQSVERLEEGVLKYTPSMVPVHARETAEGTKYIVESDMLNKLAHYSGMTMLESFEAVCEENDVDPDNVYVVAEDPDEDLGEKCCAESVADVETAINIDYKIQNKYDDLNSLTEAGIQMLFIDSISESAVNPELKQTIKSVGKKKDDPEAYESKMVKALKSIYNSADSVADYKYVKNQCNNFLKSSDNSQIQSLVSKCNKKIESRKEEDRENKLASKEYRRDQLAARKKEKQANRAAKRAAKASASEC